MRIAKFSVVLAIYASFVFDSAAFAAAERDLKSEARKSPAEQREAIERRRMDLDTVRQGLLSIRLRTLNFTEADVAKLLASAEDGSEQQHLIAQYLIAIARRSGFAKDPRQGVLAIRMMRDRLEAMAQLTEQPTVRYFPKDSVAERKAAMLNGNILNSHENWKAWVYIAENDVAEAVSSAADSRTIIASPAYSVTKNYPEFYQRLFSHLDPYAYRDHNRLIGVIFGNTRGLYNAKATSLTAGERAICSKIALDVWRHYRDLDPKVKSSQAWHENFDPQLGLMDSAPETYELFDAIDFSNKGEAESALRSIMSAADANSSIGEDGKGDERIYAIAKTLLETEVYAAPLKTSSKALLFRVLHRVPFRLVRLFFAEFSQIHPANMAQRIGELHRRFPKDEELNEALELLFNELGRTWPAYI